jgi:superfamily I DNA/RNA helicase
MSTTCFGNLDYRIADLSHYEYFQWIERHDGEIALFRKPKLLLGTIHASKGLEADHVTLCESWATRPAANLMTGQGQAEACVAYVACSRHRVSLTIEPAVSGTPYPFPPPM